MRSLRRKNMEILKILNILCSEKAVSGSERNLLPALKKILPSTLSAEVDKIGNIHIKGGEGERKILLDAHCDQIGFTVTGFCDNGFLKVRAIGGIDARTLIASRIEIFGKEKLLGVFSSVPPHLQKDGDAKKFPAVDELAVDIGLPLERAKELVSLGDIAVVENEAFMLNQNKFCASALDNKAGCAVMLSVMDRLFSENTLKNTCVELILTSQEEVGLRGAKATDVKGFDEAISVDVSFGSYPGAPEENTGALGKGAMLGHSPFLSKRITNQLEALSEKLDIPLQHEVMGEGTGTNADALSLSPNIEAALISIPLRNMHSQAEIVDIRDLENAARLIEAYIKEADAR